MPKESCIVLYVEDEEVDRFLMQRVFGKVGLADALRMVNDGQAAMDYLSGTGRYADREQHPLPSVVLLDLNLPEVHGFEVLKWIRAHPTHSGLPVVIFSSSVWPEDQVRAESLGAEDFVAKPSGVDGLFAFVQRLNEKWLSRSLADRS